MLKRIASIAAALLLTYSVAQTTWAHFPWLVSTEDGKATLYFGENIADKTYKLPASLAKTDVKWIDEKGELKSIKMATVETESLVGLQSVEALPSGSTLFAPATFGIYHGSLLSYYAVHQSGKLPTARPDSAAQRKEGLFATVVAMKAGVEVQVTWKGEPLAGAEVHLYNEAGDEKGTALTNQAGQVVFTDDQLQPGLNGLMVGQNLKKEGKLKDAAYESESHYLTATFLVPQMTAAETTAGSSSAKFPPLPFAVTSFGAARLGDAIYTYGGHTGDAHSYSNKGQSNKLLRLDLNNPGQTWQEVAEGERQQGLGMVAYKNQIILIGGFTARNEEGQEHDLHSLPRVRAYDLDSKSWIELPELPEPRSSHDAALVGNTIYVVGGWSMAGKEKTVWHETAWSMDLSAPELKWVAIANPPFKRRAVATVAHQEKLFVIGGMNDNGGPTKAVAVYDPATNAWSELPELVGKKNMAGFGAAGWSIDGQLIVTTYEGDIEFWDEAARSWKVLGQSSDARFFHRLLPIDKQRLVSIGGANMESGKFLDLEVIAVRTAIGVKTAEAVK